VSRLYFAEPKYGGNSKASLGCASHHACAGWLIGSSKGRLVQHSASKWIALVTLAAASAGVRAAGDAAQGEKTFALCSGCHAIDQKNRPTGPHLSGIYGRKAGTAEGYRYTQALKASGITWDEKNLDQYLEDPAKRIPGTSMPVQMSNQKERADLIAFLKTLK
jgi:cytochrome c